MLNAHIVTLFPDVCRSYLKHSIPARALEDGVFCVNYYNPIDKVPPKKRVDARSYGGGPGMVLQAEPILSCYDDIQKYKGFHKSIFLTPSGTTFTQEKAKEYVEFDNVTLFCGHYEGIDERIATITSAEKVSIGDFILTGGELPALVLLDAMIRELPNVLGNANSLEDTRVSSPEVYTRPETLEYKGEKYSVPKVLLSGDHKKIDKYRLSTRKGRKD